MRPFFPDMVPVVSRVPGIDQHLGPPSFQPTFNVSGVVLVLLALLYCWAQRPRRDCGTSFRQHFEIQVPASHGFHSSHVLVSSFLRWGRHCLGVLPWLFPASPGESKALTLGIFTLHCPIYGEDLIPSPTLLWNLTPGGSQFGLFISQRDEKVVVPWARAHFAVPSPTITTKKVLSQTCHCLCWLLDRKCYSCMTSTPPSNSRRPPPPNDALPEELQLKAPIGVGYGDFRRQEMCVGTYVRVDEVESGRESAWGEPRKAYLFGETKGPPMYHQEDKEVSLVSSCLWKIKGTAPKAFGFRFGECNLKLVYSCC